MKSVVPLKESLGGLDSPGRRTFLQTAAGGMLFALLPSPTAARRTRPNYIHRPAARSCQTGCRFLQPGMFDLSNSRRYSVRNVSFYGWEIVSSFEILILGRTGPSRQLIFRPHTRTRRFFMLLYGDVYNFPSRPIEDMDLTANSIFERYQQQITLEPEIGSASGMRRYHIYSNVLIELMRNLNDISIDQSRSVLLENASTLILSENGIMYRLMHDSLRNRDLYSHLGMELREDVRSMLERIIQEAVDRIKEEMFLLTLCNVQNILLGLLQNIHDIIVNISIARQERSRLSLDDYRLNRMLEGSGVHIEVDPIFNTRMDRVRCQDQPTQDSQLQADLGSCQTLVIQPRLEGAECLVQEGLPCLFEDGSAQMTNPPSTASSGCRLGLRLAVV